MYSPKFGKHKETDKLLDVHNLSNLSYNGVNNLNRSITANEIEVVILNSPNQKKAKGKLISATFFLTFN